MSRFILRALLSLLSISIPFAGAAQTFDLNTSPTQVISTTGLWRFHTGDDLRWADPEFDDSAWALLRSDVYWSQQPGYKDYRGVAWYRFRVVVPKSMIGPLVFQRPDLTQSFELFANGKKIAFCGSLLPHPREMFCPLHFHAVPPVFSEGALIIAIRVWSGPGFNISGAAFDSRLGTTSAMKVYEAARHDDRGREDTMSEFMVLFQTLSALSLLAFFLIDRRNPEYLWFAVFLLCIALERTAILYTDFSPINSNLQDGYERIFGGFSKLAELAFFYTLLRAKRSRLMYLAILGCLLDAAYRPLVVYIPWARAHYSSIWFVPHTVELFTALWIVLLVIRRAREGWSDARLLLIPVLIEQFFDHVFIYYHDILIVFVKRHTPFIQNISVLSEPFDVRLEAFEDLFFMLAMLAILNNRFIRVRREEERIASELEAARTVQKIIIPEKIQVIPGFTIASAYHPAQEVGGDFFQVLSHADGNTLIVLGDVSGKGLPAAMTGSLIVGALRMVSEYTSSPSQILAALNRSLIGRGTGFTTCLVLQISPAGRLTLANAGHLAPYLNGHELLVEPSLPLGVATDITFLEQSIDLTARDHLTLLTDGVPEAALHGELFGFSRTEELSGRPPNVIADTARTFGQTDDITVLSVVFD